MSQKVMIEHTTTCGFQTIVCLLPWLAIWPWPGTTSTPGLALSLAIAGSSCFFLIVCLRSISRFSCLWYASISFSSRVFKLAAEPMSVVSQQHNKQIILMQQFLTLALGTPSAGLSFKSLVSSSMSWLSGSGLSTLSNSAPSVYGNFFFLRERSSSPAPASGSSSKCSGGFM